LRYVRAEAGAVPVVTPSVTAVIVVFLNKTAINVILSTATVKNGGVGG
jgi:hypothetical protein